MSDAHLRALERAAQSSGDPETIYRYLRAMARAGQSLSAERIREMGRLLELRQAMRLPPGQRPPGWSNSQNLLRNAARLLHQLNRTGYGGLGPGRASEFSRPEARRWLAELAQRGSATRAQLAQFIRTLRSNPQTAIGARMLVGAGGASASLRLVGGQMAKGMAARTAVLRAGMAAAIRGAGAFVATPAGLAIAAGLVLAAAAAWWYFSEPSGRSELEQQVAAVNCDCANIDAGLLNVGWIPVCRDNEQAILDEVDAGNFELQTDGSVITGGDVCGNIAGPAAWPVIGAPANPGSLPPRDTQSCTEFVGLMQRCADD